MSPKPSPIYLDYAAATPLDPDVLAVMMPYFTEMYANPSGLHTFARQGRAALDISRKRIADILHCAPEEIFFTGGGTESNNWTIFGSANATSKKHLITTSIEHHSILYAAKELERRGYTVTYLPVNKDGFINIADLEKSLTPETFLVSIMYGNNEIGTVENIAMIGKMLRERGVFFHTDACQAAGFLPLHPEELKVDLMTTNSGKIYGPKGVGALYIKKGTLITPLLYGGGQEHRLRAGTENVAGIVGFAEAFQKAEKMRETENKRLGALRDNFIKDILGLSPKFQLNGPVGTLRLPNNINILFRGISSESMLIQLDMEGICASGGSACASGSTEPSHVLLGIGHSPEAASECVRFSLGRETTIEQLQKVVSILKKYATMTS